MRHAVWKVSPGKSHRRVAVLIGSSLTWREEVMRGIASYAHERGPRPPRPSTLPSSTPSASRRNTPPDSTGWHVYSAPEGEEAGLFFTDAYPWDGVIFRPGGDVLAERVMKLRVPAVAVGSAPVDGQRVGRVKVDDHALVDSVVNYLLNLGARRLAYCSFHPDEDRGSAMRLIARQRQLHLELCFATPNTPSKRHAPPTPLTWQQRQKQLVQWVRKLTRSSAPTGLTGILCWNPDVACQLVEACKLAGVDIPGTLAVVSADEDRFKCELTRPTITSTPIPAARIGYEAALLLDRMMEGLEPPRDPVLVKPSCVIKVRGSTAVEGAASADRDVAIVASLMEDRVNAGQAVHIAQLARHIGVSRRWLERHFTRILSQTPGQRLRHLRLERAKLLLTETDWPLAKIACGIGIRDTSHFVKLFKLSAGVTPGVFRNRVRVRK